MNEKNLGIWEGIVYGIVIGAFVTFVSIVALENSNNYNDLNKYAKYSVPPECAIKIIPLNETFEGQRIFMSDENEACVLIVDGACGFNADEKSSICAEYFGAKKAKI